MLSRFLSTITFVAAALGASTTDASTFFTGDGTAYTLGSVSSGNCNFMSAIGTASTNYVAINAAQWAGQTVCGRCVEVSCIDSRCTSTKGVTRTLQVLDQCPGCASGDLDMPPAIFKAITGSDPARYKIQWRFVDCPNPGTIKLCTKVGSSGYWTAIQPTNFLTGVKSLTINGKPATMLDSAYYYLQTNSQNPINMGAVTVAVTSIFGDVVQGTFSLTANACTDTKKQFTIHTSRRLLEGNSTTSVVDEDGDNLEGDY